MPSHAFYGAPAGQTSTLGLPPTAYYEWRKQEPSARAQRDRKLAEKVKAIFCRSRQTYRHPGCIGSWDG